MLEQNDFGCHTRTLRLAILPLRLDLGHAWNYGRNWLEDKLLW